MQWRRWKEGEEKEEEVYKSVCECYRFPLGVRVREYGQDCGASQTVNGLEQAGSGTGRDIGVEFRNKEV